MVAFGRPAGGQAIHFCINVDHSSATSTLAALAPDRPGYALCDPNVSEEHVDPGAPHVLAVGVGGILGEGLWAMSAD